MRRWGPELEDVRIGEDRREWRGRGGRHRLDHHAPDDVALGSCNPNLLDRAVHAPLFRASTAGMQRRGWRSARPVIRRDALRIYGFLTREI
jgi:hypothetical protein